MRFVLLLLLGLALAGCTGSTPPGCDTWHCRDVTANDPPWRDTVIPSGVALEMDFSLRAGDELAWDWFVSEREEIGFQMHYHESNGLDKTIFDKYATDEASSYVAETSNTYSLLWINDTPDDLEVWLQVEGEVCYPDANGGSRCAVFIEI